MLPFGFSLFSFVAASCCLLILSFGVIRYHRNRNPRQIRPSGILASLSHVDIDAFRKLTDPMEEAFLRQSHTRTVFGDLQKDRIHSALEYLRKMQKNAITLQRLGYRNLKSGRPTQRLLAEQLIDCAVPVRMFTFSGIAVLRLWRLLRIQRFILVSFSLADLKDLMEELLPAYQLLKEAALELTILSEPESSRELARNL